MKLEKTYELYSIEVSFGYRKIDYRDEQAYYTYKNKSLCRRRTVNYDIERYFKAMDKYLGKRKRGYNEPCIVIKELEI